MIATIRHIVVEMIHYQRLGVVEVDSTFRSEFADRLAQIRVTDDEQVAAVVNECQQLLDINASQF